MKRIRWFLRGGIALSLAGAGAVVGIPGHTAARADTTLLGYTAQADANTMDILIDNAAGLTGVHPLTEMDIPEDSSDYETGPMANSLASVAWPGATAGNVGSLLGQLGLPDQFSPIIDKLNDPVRAQSSYPSGAKDSAYPPNNNTGAVEMRTHSDATRTWAKAGFSDLSQTTLFTVQDLQGATSATATSVAKAEASGSFSSLSLLGGLITVGATSSTALATSDGKKPAGTTLTHLGAISILGHPVSFGSDGLVVGPATATGLDALTTPTVQTVNQLLKLIDLKITPLPKVVSSKAPAESITSGGLQISFTLPQDLHVALDCTALNKLPSQLTQLGVLCTLPGLLAGANVTMTLARVTVQAIASPPFGGSVGSVPKTPTAGTSGSGVPGTAASSGSVAGSSALGGNAQIGSGGAASGASPPAVAGQPQGPGTSQLASLSSPVRASLLSLLLLLALVAGGLLLRLSRALDAPPVSACPLGEKS